jgi:Protein of unknown function (DUF3592)
LTSNGRRGSGRGFLRLTLAAQLRAMAVIGPVFGLVCLGAAGYSWRQTSQLLEAGERTQGSVVAIDYDARRGLQFPIVAFRDRRGRPYQVELRTATSSRRYVLGEPLPLIYDPAEPTAARADDETLLYVASRILGTMGGIGMLIGVAALAARRRLPQVVAGSPLTADAGDARALGFLQIGILFLIIGVGLLGGAAYWAEGMRQQAARGVHVTGSIVGVARGSNGGGFPIFRFRSSDGRMHEVRSVTSSGLSYAAWDPVQIVYEEGDPQGARLDEGWRSYLGPMALAALGFVFTLLGAVAVLWRRHFDRNGVWVLWRRDKTAP